MGVTKHQPILILREIFSKYKKIRKKITRTNPQKFNFPEELQNWIKKAANEGFAHQPLQNLTEENLGVYYSVAQLPVVSLTEITNFLDVVKRVSR